MSLVPKYFFLIALTLFFGGCAAWAPIPSPEQIPFEQALNDAQGPERRASMQFVSKGRAELLRSRYGRASTHLSRAIEIDATNPFAYFFMARARFEARAYAQSAELFGRAIELFESYADWKAESLAYRGESLERLNRKDAALKNFEKALDLDGHNERAKNGLARFQTKKGEPDA